MTGEGILKTIDLLGATIAHLEADNQALHAEVEMLRQANAAHADKPAEGT